MDKNQLIELVEKTFGIDFVGFTAEIDDPTKYIGSRFLPNKDIYDYDWKETLIDNTVAMAKPLARGEAEAPLIGGPALKEAMGSIIGWGQKFQVNKKVLNKIFNPRNDSELKAMLRRILDEAARNVRAAQQRREWLRWGYLAKDEIIVTEIGLKVALGIPKGNKYTVGSSAVAGFSVKPRGQAIVSWDTAASAKPIDDIVNLCEEYYTINNEMPDAVIMRRSQLLQLLNTVDTKDDDSGKGLKSLADVNNYLASLGMSYPQIETYDEFVRLEDKNGRPTLTEDLIPERRIVLLKEASSSETEDIGRLMMGPVAENNFQPGIYTTIYEETDPLKYWHFMATEMWPGQYHPEKVMFADVVSKQ